MSAHRETSFMSTVVDLAPRAAAQRFDLWARRLMANPGSTCPEGHLVLQLLQNRPDPVGDLPLRRADGQLRATRWSLGGISLELSAWSAGRTELGIRHTGRTSQLSVGYYAIGHTALSELADALRDGELAPPSRMFRAAVTEADPVRLGSGALARLTRMSAPR
jgi:hypothetical protein